MTAFDPDLYLACIRHPGDVRATADGLEGLHRAQVGTIPFENFDVLLGRGVSLTPEALVAKLVRRPRGGYCFELNGLFLMALRAFGFEARALLARVHRGGTPSGRSHQVSLVTTGARRWVCDVGFGAPHLPAPLPLELGPPVTLDRETFRLADGGPYGIMLQILLDGVWRDLYSFDLGHVFAADIVYGNHYTSTHPDSFFTDTRVAALPLPGGRVTLLDRTLRTVSGGAEEVSEVAEGQAYLDMLKTHFGIVLDAPYEALPPLRARTAEEESAVPFR